MTDFAAALGTGQLERFSAELAKRRELVDRYRLRLAKRGDIALPRAAPGHSWQTFMIVLDAAIDRNAVRSAMRASGVECGLGAQALNCLTYFQRRYGFAEQSFPNATRLYRQGLALPLHGRLSEADVEQVCDLLEGALRAGRRR